MSSSRMQPADSEITRLLCEVAARPGCLAFAIDDHPTLLPAEFLPVEGGGWPP